MCWCLTSVGISHPYAMLLELIALTPTLSSALASHRALLQNWCVMYPSQAMSVAKKMYPSVEGRCKDYVMHPKPNGYQSLHSTHEVSVSPAAAASAGGERHTHFELQVRSASMHHKAEYGHAAHWSYKSDDGGAKAGGVGERRSWRSYDRLKAAGARRTGIDSPTTAVPDSVSSGKELVTWLHLELRQRKVCGVGVLCIAVCRIGVLCWV